MVGCCPKNVLQTARLLLHANKRAYWCEWDERCRRRAQTLCTSLNIVFGGIARRSSDFGLWVRIVRLGRIAGGVPG